jgi:thiosulfate reductase cytochrome b subunit
MTEERIYLYPVWVRLWHLLNAVLCLILIITGISMQFSNPKFPMIRFDVAVSIHNIVGIILSVDYLFFFLGNFLTRNGRYYKLILPGLYSRLMIQFKFYTKGLFKGESSPFPLNSERKFNPLQQVTYVGAMYVLLPIIMISGWALLYPEVIPARFLWSSGLHLTDLFHIIAAFLVSLFMFIHIYFCTIGKSPFSNFKSMIDGFHESH